MRVILLGTSSMTPTAKRNHPGVYVEIDKFGLLFDAGECIQRQIRIAKIKPSKIKYIFVTHWHGDHCLGLPGLLQMLVANNIHEINIVGPKGTNEHLKHMLKAFEFSGEMKIKVYEEKEIDLNEYKIEFMHLKHSTTTLAYRIIEKEKIKLIKEKLKEFGISGPVVKELKEGKCIKVNEKEICWNDVGYKTKERNLLTYITDTLYFEKLSEFARDAHLLIIESTYSKKDKEKAKEHKHMCVDESIQVGKNAEVKALVLTHFSQRYKEVKEIEKDVKEILQKEKLNFNIKLGYDFDEYLVI